MDEALTVTIKKAQSLTGLSKSSIYNAIADQRLQAVKFGRRTLVKVESLRQLVGAA